MFTIQKRVEVRVMYKGFDNLNWMLQIWGIWTDQSTETQPISRLLLPVMGAIQHSTKSGRNETPSVMRKLEYVKQNADQILQLAKATPAWNRTIHDVLEGTYQWSSSGYSITAESMRSLIEFTRLIFQKVDKALT